MNFQSLIPVILNYNNSQTSIPPQLYNNKIKVNRLLAHFYEKLLGENILNRWKYMIKWKDMVILFNLFWPFRDRIPETTVFFINTLSFVPPILALCQSWCNYIRECFLHVLFYVYIWHMFPVPECFVSVFFIFPRCLLLLYYTPIFLFSLAIPQFILF